MGDQGFIVRYSRQTYGLWPRSRKRASMPREIVASPSMKRPLEARENVGCERGLRRPRHRAQPERTMIPAVKPPRKR